MSQASLATLSRELGINPKTVAKRQRFKRYPIGFFHIDIAEVQTAKGKLYLFVGIDRSGYIYSASPVLTSLGADQDLTGFEGTVYVDLSAHYTLTRHIQLTLNGINLTNQSERQYSDSTKRLYVVTRSGTTLLGGVRVTF